jgi:gluconate 2-dehydrogenase gamma chain
MKYSLSRRYFLKSASAGVSGILLLSKCGNNIISKWHFFTDSEAADIEAMCEQIVPADNDPGAKAANVIYFIDKQLVSNYITHQETYRKGIIGLNETSRAMFGNKFAKLSWENQYQVMLALESGKAKGETWKNFSPAIFFKLVRDHTMQGFYGSPHHGGNKDYVSYRMLGIDTPIVIGQNRYHSKI